jgi:uncharacterized protein
MRLPDVPPRLGLGIGLDLPYGAPIGFSYDAERGHDRVAERVFAFLRAHAEDVRSVFFSFQPRSRNRLALDEYAAAWDDLFARLPPVAVRAVHQTLFNLGALEPYDRGAIVDLTNALAFRYKLAWVNEDLGLWSLHGRPLPYPLPPYLTQAGLAASIANVSWVQERLAVPLLVEFPGFSEGTNLVIGGLHAYDYFRRLAEDSGSPVTLDVGHLLSYQWLRGRRGSGLYADLERLPLAHCVEIHLSGAQVSRGFFQDFHHGILLEEQLVLLEHLLVACPNLRVVTYEDPKFDAAGAVIPKAAAGFARLRETVARWAA